MEGEEVGAHCGVDPDHLLLKIMFQILDSIHIGTSPVDPKLVASKLELLLNPRDPETMKTTRCGVQRSHKSDLTSLTSCSRPRLVQDHK